MIGRATSIVAGAVAGVALLASLNAWTRNDARNDLLRELTIQQIERNEEDSAERDRRTEELNNADNDDVRRLACDLGMLPEDACN